MILDMKDHMNSIHSSVSDISALFREPRYSVTIAKELRFLQNVLTLGAEALVPEHGRYGHTSGYQKVRKPVQ